MAKCCSKEAHQGGAWEWHQDYGYWYNQGFVFPSLISAFVALDPATQQNGCLQVLRASHKLGRLEHGKVGTQPGADPSRMTQLEPLFERVYCGMMPGSVLFFHSNLLHSSGPNVSDKHRRSFIICYNALGNPQLTEAKWSEQLPARSARTMPSSVLLSFPPSKVLGNHSMAQTPSSRQAPKSQGYDRAVECAFVISPRTWAVFDGELGMRLISAMGK